MIFPGKTRRRRLLAAACIPFGLSFAHAAPHELLYLEFDNPSNLGAQRGLTPVGTVFGDLSAAPGSPSAADLGSTGRVYFPTFSQPRGSFTVEARVLLRSYAPVDTRHISDVVNTALWVGGFQGFTLRLGGGYLYATPPRQAYASDAEYQASLDYYGHTGTAYYSRCVGEFLTASTQYPSWKEVVTDRCLDLNRWVYLVGTWDGQNLRIYLDGADATDPWRINGAGLQPAIDSTAALYVGALTLDNYDSRHTDGLVDFVRILDTAMGPVEVKDRYRGTLDPIERDRCRVKADPEYPVGGRCVRGDDRFRIRKSREGDCSSGGNRDRDTVEVEFSKSPLFDSVFLTHVTSDTVFQIDSAALDGKDSHSGPTYWRCRSRNSGTLAKAAASAVPEEWSLPAQIMMDIQTNPSKVLPPGPKARRMVLESGRRAFLPASEYPVKPKLYGLDGKAAAKAFRACAGGWCLDADSAELGVFLFR